MGEQCMFKSATIGKISSITTIPNLEKYKPNIPYHRDCSSISDGECVEIESSEISSKVMNELLGIDKSKFPDSYEVEYQKMVQARKHKKKRINKKWLKRYGYKVITCRSKGWKLHCNANGTFEFIKELT